MAEKKCKLNPETKTLRIIIGIIALILLILTFSMNKIAETRLENAQAKADAFKEEHYIEITKTTKKYSYWSGSYSSSYTYEDWDTEENEAEYDKILSDGYHNYYETKNVRSFTAIVSVIFGLAYLGIAGILSAMSAKTKKFINWLDTFYDDTARKLIKIIKLLAKILCVIIMLCGFIAMFAGIAYAIIGSLGIPLVLISLLCPLATSLTCLIIQAYTAISVMTINMIADVSAIRKKTCEEAKIEEEKE